MRREGMRKDSERRLVGDSAGKSSSARAFELFGQANALESMAAEALKTGRVQVLEGLAAKGWAPIVGDGDGERIWAAMQEQSGASLRWLLERYPRETVGARYWLDARSDSIDTEAWSVAAMLEFEDAGLALLGPSGWLTACFGARRAGDYVKQSLARDGGWGRAPMRGASFAALFEKTGELEEAGILDEAIAAAAGWARDAAKEATAESLSFGREASRSALRAMEWCSAPEALSPVWMALSSFEGGCPGAAMRGAQVSLDRFGPGRLDAAAVAKARSAMRMDMGSARWAEEFGAQLPLGFFALALGFEPTFRLALESGWIAPMTVVFEEEGAEGAGRFEATPMELLLAFGDAWDADFGLKAAALSKSGWTLSHALASQTPLGAVARGRAEDRRFFSALSLAREQEALEQACAIELPKSRSPSL